MKHHNSAKDLFQRSQLPFNHSLNLKQSVATPLARPRECAGGFWNSIPVVENSRLIKVNLCRQVAPAVIRTSANKVSFTYLPPEQKPHLPPVVTVPSAPTRSYPIYTSIVYPVYSPIPQDNPHQANANPAPTKIKKPNPTQRKETLID
jgi:hypothetical protein